MKKIFLSRGVISKTIFSLFVALFLFLGLGAFFFFAQSPVILHTGETAVVREIAANGSFEIQFSEWMDKKSAEDAVSILPPVAGKFIWENEKILRFLPTEDLPLGQKYIVSINQTAKSIFLKHLVTPLSFTYMVVSVPKITMVSPISAADWNSFQEKKEKKALSEPAFLQKNQPITILFDRPIRPLGDDPNTFDPADFLEFSLPNITGTTKWLGTNAFEFVIDEKSFPNAMNFSVHLKPGIPTLDGGKITDDISWNLYTQEPKLLSVSAGDVPMRVGDSSKTSLTTPPKKEKQEEQKDYFTGKNVLPDSRIVLEWNMPVELESLFKHMEIKPERKIKDDLIIQDQGDKHFVYLEFTPPLKRNEQIDISIMPGVAPLFGERASESGTEISFSTLSNTCLSLLNKKGEPVSSLDISPDDTISFDFCSFMEQDAPHGPIKNQAEAVKNVLSFSPEIPKDDISVSCYKTKCDVSFSAQPQTQYSVSFSSDFTDTLGQKVPIDKFSADIFVHDYAPFLSPMTRGGMRSVMDNSEEMGVYFSARNVPEVLVRTCIVPDHTVSDIESRGGWEWSNFSCDEGINVQKVTQKLSEEKNKMFVFKVDTHEAREKENIVFWEVSSPLIKNPWNDNETRVFSGVLFPANASLTAKSGHNFVQVWATDFTTGKPISDLSLQFFGSQSKLLSTQKTDKNGLAFFEKPEDMTDFFIRANSSVFSAYVGSGWDSGISPWDFGIDFNWNSVPRTDGVAFTDRPIYRPKDKVSFKAILRQDFDAKFFLPEEKTAQVVITDSKGNIVFNEEKFLSDFGSLSGSFSLSENTPTGRYFLSVGNTNSADTYTQFAEAVFWVEEYKKPVFDVSLTLPKEEFVRGETMDVSLSSHYFFGAPLPDAEVSWYVISTPLYFDRFSGTGWFSFGMEDDACYWGCAETEEVVMKGEGKTDENGNFSFSLPANVKKNSLYTIRATVKNKNAQTTTMSKTVPVFAGESVLGIRANDFYIDASSSQVSAEAVVSDLSGKGISGKRFVATLQKVIWNSIKKEGVDGNYYWENTQEFLDLDVISASSGIGGKTKITFPLKDNEDYFGQLRIIISLEDTKGNTVSASTSVWRGSEKYMTFGKQENSQRIPLEIQSPKVRVGDNITILPASPFSEKVPALITVERQEILFQKVVMLVPGQPISLPATKEMVPNAFISVILSKGKGKMGQVAPFVRSYYEIKEKKEQLHEKILATNKKIDSITEKMKTAELGVMKSLEKGLDTYTAQLSSLEKEKEQLETEQKKAKGEIALVLGEDAPVPSVTSSYIAPEQKIGMVSVKVSAEDNRLSVKIVPEKDEYLPGEIVRANIKVKDSLGQPVPAADVSLSVVDASILALKSRQNEDIFDVFYRIRALGIRTMSTMTQFANRLNVRSAKGEKGGGGGGDLALLQKKRGDFRDTAFWTASTTTNGNGIASVEFPLPDNTTTWQMWSTVNTLNSSFGSAKKNFFSRKPLLISPILPRFLVAGDIAHIGFSVHNQTETDVIVRPEFSGENVHILQKNDESFRVPAGKSNTIFFSVQAQANFSENENIPLPVRLTMSALGDTANAIDTIEVSLPVMLPTATDSFATSGILSPEHMQAQEKVYIDKNILSSLSRVYISFTSGVLGNVSSALSTLAHYPYGCAEQIMSTHLPNIALSLLQKEIGMQLLPEGFDLKKSTSLALQSLYDLQQYNGGFSFWRNSSRTYPFLSAYILFGLEQTKEAGYSVDENVLKNLRGYLANKLLEDIRDVDFSDAEHTYAFADSNARAFALYALSLGTKLDSSLLSHLYEKRFVLSPEGQAFLLLAVLNTLSQDSDSTMADTLVKLLEAEVQQQDRTAFFTAKENTWNFSSDIRTTSVVLLALQKYDSSHLLLPKMVQFLRDTKSKNGIGGPWGSTQDTAWALLALAEYTKESVSHDSDISLSLNGKQLLTKTIAANSASFTTTFSGDDMEKGIINTFDFAEKKGGIISYDVVYNALTDATNIAARNEGFGVIREYFLQNSSSLSSISHAKVGDMLKGKVTLLVPKNRYFVGVTIPLPAGIEAINFALDTEDKGLEKTINVCGSYWCPENDLWRFTHREYRDDHIFLFADFLPAGRYDFEFLARATTAGEFSHLPAHAEEIYHPEIYGRSEGGKFQIQN